MVDSNGEPCEGIEVTPSEGCFGPQFSEPKKERNPITKVVLRPYGDKVKFEVKWAKYNPPTYASGVTAGPQRTWNADHPFPSDGEYTQRHTAPSHGPGQQPASHPQSASSYSINPPPPPSPNHHPTA